MTNTLITVELGVGRLYGRKGRSVTDETAIAPGGAPLPAPDDTVASSDHADSHGAGSHDADFHDADSDDTASDDTALASADAEFAPPPRITFFGELTRLLRTRPDWLYGLLYSWIFGFGT